VLGIGASATVAWQVVAERYPEDWPHLAQEHQR
jgi:hypothetical protein